MSTPTFFEVRDRLDDMLLGPWAKTSGGCGPATSLLRTLLEHTWYISDRYGWVNRKVTPVKALAALTATSNRTVIRGLGDLQDAGVLVKVKHYEGYARKADDIRMDILWEWFPSLGAREAPRASAREAPRASAREAPTTYTKEV